MSKIPSAFLIFLLRAYQRLISPFFGSACRFHPSCSHYAIDALNSHGLLRGGGFALRRVARCHPWHPGGFDPVPSSKPDLSHHG